MSVVGVLLAAGDGSRMGMPKALVSGDEGLPWAVSASRVLARGGCGTVVVVTGAAASDVRDILSAEPVHIVEAADWEDGMGASLRAGLKAVAGTDATAALIGLVDLPDVGADVVARMIEHVSPGALARASYGHSEPGHPVLIGRDHWSGVAASALGDRGARDYMASHRALDIDCSDLATGLDIDTPQPRLGP